MAPVLHVEQNGNKNNPRTREIHMFQLMRDSMALVSVTGFVWMVCQVAHLLA